MSYPQFSKRVRPMFRFRQLESVSNSFGFTIPAHTIVPLIQKKQRPMQWLLANCRFHDQPDYNRPVAI